MNDSPNDLKTQLYDIEYREAYAEDFSNTYVASQIQILREQRGLSQEQLAEMIGTKQPGISRLENVNHSSWRTVTLRRVANALGVWLKISFETYGDLLLEADKFGRQALQRPSFKNDPFFHGLTDAEIQPAPNKTYALQTVAGNQGRSFQPSLNFAAARLEIVPKASQGKELTQAAGGR